MTGRAVRPRDELPGVDPAAYRRTAGHFASGVTVVTARAGDRDHGMTVSSFASVSLSPVLVAVCIERSARLHEFMLLAGQWGISVLAADQQDIAATFARQGRPTGEGFDMVAHHRGPATGALLFDAALATMECRTAATYPGGDHTVVLGAVLAVSTPRPDASPLLYFKGGYWTPR